MFCAGVGVGLFGFCCFFLVGWSTVGCEFDVPKKTVSLEEKD